MASWQQPPHVQQAHECTCWAAALESWLKATPFGDNIFKSAARPDGVRRDSIDQNWLIAAFGESDGKNAFVCNGQLSPALQRAFAQVIAPKVGMHMEVIPTPYLLDSWVATTLKNGPIYLVYQRDGSKFAHVVVVYGSDQGDDDVTVLRVVDPTAADKGGGPVGRPITYFDKAKMQAGWPTGGGFLGWFPGAPS